MIAQGLLLSDAKDRGEIPMGSPRTVAPNTRGVGKWRLSTNNSLYFENGAR